MVNLNKNDYVQLGSVKELRVCMVICYLSGATDALQNCHMRLNYHFFINRIMIIVFLEYIKIITRICI